jgi:hypothetical protein
MALNLPRIHDFRPGGRFYGVKNLSLKSDLPLALLVYIFPDYDVLHNKLPAIKEKYLFNIKKLCVQLNTEVKQEERRKRKDQLHELETRKLEQQILKHHGDKMRAYYDGYYRNLYNNKQCSCKLSSSTTAPAPT